MAEVNNYEWLNYIPEGWKNLGRQMIAECETIDPRYEIVVMKEKYGILRTCSRYYQDGIAEIESRYEDISSKTCCKCGAPATKISTGWILPWCDECGTDEERFYKALESSS